MKVIVNVDDVGLHPSVQRAVEVCASAGVVTSASVLANGPCVRDARRLKGIGLAAHLNVLRGRPLSPTADVRSLLRADGLMLGNYAELFRRYAFGQLVLAEVELEWDRQITSLLELGLPLTHLDSEKHIHCWPRLMPIACRLAEKHGLSWVRRSVEPVSWWNQGVGGWRARALSIWGRWHEPHPGIGWPDALWGLAAQGRNLTASRWRSDLPKLRGCGVVEISCHPGLPHQQDGELPAEFGRLRVADWWQTEVRTLLDPDWLAVFREHDLKLTHYGELSPADNDAAEMILPLRPNQAAQAA